jgi:hypothetical protein
LIHHSISDGVEAIHDNIRVIRAQFKPLLDPDVYLEDVSRLVEVVPLMLDNIDELTKELNRAFTILSDTPKRD